VYEIVKLIGGVAWLVGLVMLFLLPPLGILILLLAIVLTILSVVWTRQRRQNELIQALSSPMARPNPADAPAPSSPTAHRPNPADAPAASSPTAHRPNPADAPDPTARLVEILELKASGAISADEYAQARKGIFDEL
jgi:hypothetical protein